MRALFVERVCEIKNILVFRNLNVRESFRYESERGFWEFNFSYLYVLFGVG